MMRPDLWLFVKRMNIYIVRLHPYPSPQLSLVQRVRMRVVDWAESLIIERGEALSSGFHSNYEEINNNLHFVRVCENRTN